MVRYLVSNRNNSSCITRSLGQAREPADHPGHGRSARSLGKPEQPNEYARENAASGINRRGRYTYMKRSIDSSQLLAGKLSGTMSHDMASSSCASAAHGTRRHDHSRHRCAGHQPAAQQTDELKPFHDIQWKSVLDLLMAYQMYRVGWSGSCGAGRHCVSCCRRGSFHDGYIFPWPRSATVFACARQRVCAPRARPRAAHRAGFGVVDNVTAGSTISSTNYNWYIPSCMSGSSRATSMCRRKWCHCGTSSNLAATGSLSPVLFHGAGSGDLSARAAVHMN